MNDRFHDEDRTIEEALEGFDGFGAPSGEAPAPGGPDETLRRLYTEAFGLLAYEAEPAIPRPESKARLLAALTPGGSAAGEGTPGRADGVAQEAEEPSVVVAFGPREEEKASAAGAAQSAVPAAAGAPTRRNWASLVAAVFAVLAFGLAAFLWVQLDQSRATLTRLEQEQRQLIDTLTAQTQTQQVLASQAGRLGGLVSVVSTPGVEICPMRPVGDSPLAPGSFAVLYMPPGQESWFLVVSNLRPAAHGVYKVWLTTADGPVSAGVIDTADQVDGRVTLRIPPGILEDGKVLGGRMRSATVTLEPAESGDAPSGPTVLYGNTKMQVL